MLIHSLALLKMEIPAFCPSLCKHAGHQILSLTIRFLINAKSQSHATRSPVICSRIRMSDKPSLVTTKWLSHALTSTVPPAIVDVRGQVQKLTSGHDNKSQEIKYVANMEDYSREHAPTASFLDWTRLSGMSDQELIDILEESGISQKAAICVYDWGNMLFAARLWFALAHVGCTDVHVLQGGWHAWQKGGCDVSDDAQCPLKTYKCFYEENASSADAGSFNSRKTVSFASRGDVLEACGHQNTNNRSSEALVDGRSSAQFRGDERRARRAGRIPGAVSVPYRTLLNPDGIGLRSDKELQNIFRQAGLLDKNGNCRYQRVISYCNGGVASTLILLALARCGVELDTLASYDGSWNEWGNLDGRFPVET